MRSKANLNQGRLEQARSDLKMALQVFRTEETGEEEKKQEKELQAELEAVLEQIKEAESRLHTQE